MGPLTLIGLSSVRFRSNPWSAHEVRAGQPGGWVGGQEVGSLACRAGEQAVEIKSGAGVFAVAYAGRPSLRLVAD